MNADAPRDNLKGAIWLFADMALNIWALGIVKALGLDYPAVQIVFLRAGVGLLVITPWIIRQRRVFLDIPDVPLQFLRVGLSTVTLIASYYAVSRVPLALFTAMNFTRPLIVMLMAAFLLRERVTVPQWVAAGTALIGVFVAIDPQATALNFGLLVLAFAILAGCAAIAVTRRLRSTPTVVLMTFYTAGLAIFTAPLAAFSWQPLSNADLVPLLAIGVFAQFAQMCFLRAHFHGDAGVLSVLGYMSLPVSTLAGLLAFDEVPTARFFLGAILVILAAGSLAVWKPETRIKAP